MKYEEFEARAKSAFDDCSEMKRMLWNMQTVVGAVPDMVRKNERLDRENAELKQENAALQTELDDWKGNAEGFEPDAYMRLPLDADGVPIRIGDEMNIDGDAMTVLGYRLRNDMLLLVAEDNKRGLFFNPEPSRVRHFKPEPADSWEKLIEDLRNAVSSSKYACECVYLNPGKDNCEKCPALNQVCSGYAIADILARIEKLRGESDED